MSKTLRILAGALALLGLGLIQSCSNNPTVGSPVGTLSPVAKAPTQPATANGGEVSGGADTYVVLPAFYVSTDPSRTISACMEVSPDFGVPEAVLADMLNWAFSEWSDYITTHDLTYAPSQPGAIVGTLSGLHTGCTGTEDFRAYFGVQKAEVQAQLTQFLNPYGFAAISSTNADKMWHSGFVWIAPPGSVEPAKNAPTWNLASSQVPYGALKFLMLHEIGHVFGNGHVAYTVMDDRIGQELLEWTAAATVDPGPTPSRIAIDGDLDLLQNMNLDADYALQSQYGDPSADDPLSAAFVRIFGHDPQGTLTASAHRISPAAHEAHARPDANYPGTGSLSLTFNDSGGTHTATITTQAKIAQRDDSAVLFNGQHDDHYNAFGASYFGQLTAPGQNSISVIVNYDMGEKLQIIDVVRYGIERPLLESQDLN